MPQPSGIGDDLDLGSTAIGQGKVLATPLQMASVAADGGQSRGAGSSRTSCSGQRAPRRRVTTAPIARHAAPADDRRGQGRHGHGGRHPRRAGRGQDRDGGAGARPGARPTPGSWPSPRPAGRAWPSRSGVCGRAPGGDAAAPLARQVIASALGVGYARRRGRSRRLGGEPALLMWKHERAVGQRVERELEQQHRAADHALVGDVVGARKLAARRDLRGAIGERRCPRRPRPARSACRPCPRSRSPWPGCAMPSVRLKTLHEHGEPRLLGADLALGDPPRR